MTAICNGEAIPKERGNIFYPSSLATVFTTGVRPQNLRLLLPNRKINLHPRFMRLVKADRKPGRKYDLQLNLLSSATALAVLKTSFFLVSSLNDIYLSVSNLRWLSDFSF